MLRIAYFVNDGWGTIFKERKHYSTHFSLEHYEDVANGYCKRMGYTDYEIENPWDIKGDINV